MKKIFKTLAVLAAVAALGFGFVSCGDPEDDNGSSGGGNGGASSKFVPETNIKATFACPRDYQSASEAIAEAEKKEDNQSVYFFDRRINFYEDGTFIVYGYECRYEKSNGKVKKGEESIVPSYKGSYTLTGDFTEGTLNLVLSYYFYWVGSQPEFSKWVENTGAVETTYAISGSKFDGSNLVPNRDAWEEYIFTKQ